MLGKLQSYRQAAGDKSVTEGCYSAVKPLKQFHTGSSM